MEGKPAGLQFALQNIISAEPGALASTTVQRLTGISSLLSSRKIRGGQHYSLASSSVVVPTERSLDTTLFPSSFEIERPNLLLPRRTFQSMITSLLFPDGLFHWALGPPEAATELAVSK